LNSIDTIEIEKIDWSAKAVTAANIEEVIATAKYPVLMDFWATWCAPCRMMSPMLDLLAAGFKEKIIIRKIDTALYPKILPKFSVLGIPTFVIFREGKEIWRNAGALNKKQFTQVFNDVLEGNI
jgi:thioredoxin